MLPTNKHIDVEHHFIQDCVDSNLIKLLYKLSAELEADFFTKTLPKLKHSLFVKCLGLDIKIRYCVSVRMIFENILIQMLSHLPRVYRIFEKFV